MAASVFSFFCSFLLCLFTSLSQSTLLYLSPSLFFPNYQKMLESFRIYIYTPPKPFSFTSPLESLFFTSLQHSPFLTLNPDQADLFFVPFSPDASTSSLARLIKDIRTDFPYWNRTLGADHFYVSCTGLSYQSDRNLLELKKNAVQISCFASTNGRFVPHKDVTLPPLFTRSSNPHQQSTNRTGAYRGFVKYNGVKESSLMNELRSDSDFLIESEPSDEKTARDRIGRSEFCLFEYGADSSGIGEALILACVPVIITDRPIQDLPLMDVVRWQEIAVIVGSNGGYKRVKSVLDRTCGGGETCEGMRRLGVEGSRHFVWNENPQPYDAFHMVMYQLWLRRHVIRYARREIQ